MSKDLRQFLIEDCQKNKQIDSCQQCLYEKECDQTHINLILKGLGEWLTQKRDYYIERKYQEQVDFYNDKIVFFQELLVEVQIPRKEGENK